MIIKRSFYFLQIPGLSNREQPLLGVNKITNKRSGTTQTANNTSREYVDEVVFVPVLDLKIYVTGLLKSFQQTAKLLRGLLFQLLTPLYLIESFFCVQRRKININSTLF